MSDWFKCIEKFDEATKGVWDSNGGILVNWIKKWKDKNAVETHLDAKYRTLGIGQRKGLKKPIRRFVEEAEEFMDQVGNESFFNAKEEYVKDTMISLADLWVKACNAYYRRTDGASWIKREDKDKAAYEVITFGPWIFWNEHDWDDIRYKYNKWKRLQKRGEISNETVINMEPSISPSQQRRGRKNKDQSQHRKDDRSRSRTERNPRERTNNNHNKNRKDSNNNSNTNFNQEPDDIDSDASLV